MASPVSFPYEAIAVKRYKSPHKNDLSFAKGDHIRVTSLAPKDEDEEEDDEDDDEPDQWLVGETLDGSKTGTFPASHVERPAKEQGEATAPSAAARAPEGEETPKSDAKQPVETDTGKLAEVILQKPTADADKKEKAVEPIGSGAKSEEREGDASLVASSTAPATASKEEDMPPAAKAAPERKPSSPPLAPKPSGLAARIAAFNKPQEAPPPLPKGKPGSWKRPPPAPGAPKPVLPGAPPAQQAKSTSTASNTPAPASVPAASPPAVNAETGETEGQNRSNASFSAADAQSSIKMSLKERMAALQRGEDRSSAESAPSKPAAPPKAAPNKAVEERKDAASPGKEDAVAIPSTTAAKGVEEPATDGGSVEAGKREEVAEEEATDAGGGDSVDGTKELGSSDRQDGNGDEGEEKTEEDVESERRAAIAKRMAALGGRRMGGGPALFGAPAPPPKRPSVEEREGSSETRAEEAQGEVASPTAASKDGEKEAGQEPVQSAKTLAVPRRAAPPRRKKSSASSNPVAEAGAEKRSESQSDDLSRQDSQASAQSGTDKSMGIAAGAAGVGAGAMLVGGKEHLTEEPSEAVEEDDGAQADVSALTASSHGGDAQSDFEPSTPISEGQLDENARQLEEFVHPPREEEKREADVAGEEEQGDDGGEHEEAQRKPEMTASPAASLSSPQPPSSGPPRPPSVIARPPSSNSRPPSTRPPIPKSSLPNEGVGERVTSPAPSRAPPIPLSARQGSVAESNAEEEGEEEEEGEKEAVVPVLAAPRPRMAVPVDASDDEEEEDPRGPSAVSPPAPAQEDRGGRGEELSEEEEDRQRRARMAAKMARMGGQPIMGAPLAFRKPAAPASAQEPEVEPVQGEREELSEAEEAREPAALGAPIRAPSVPPVASPPPIPAAPTSPPPIPTKSPPPGMQVGSSLEKRMSQMSTSDDASLARRASLLSRPPVPNASHSRQVSREEEEEEGENEGDEPAARTTSPPPPRAPPRAPPPRQASAVEDEQRMGSGVSDGAAPKQQQPPAPQQQQQRSPRDLDLMPSSQWWRHGVPVKLPPTLLRPDTVPIISTTDSDSQHSIRVDLLFEDYSSTVVQVQYEDDDSREEATKLSQVHHFAPPRPNAEELQSWSQRHGAPVARQAVSMLQAKTSPGDGSSKAFVSALIATAAPNDILPPVGSSFGSIVLAQAATTPVDVGADEIRSGDIIALHGVDFKGKKGLTPYHATFGSAQEPTYACIIESEAKKRKLRVVLVAGVEGKRGKGPEEVSLRLDDVKSGLLRVFRLAPKTGWLAV